MSKYAVSLILIRKGFYSSSTCHILDIVEANSEDDAILKVCRNIRDIKKYDGFDYHTEHAMKIN